MAINLPRFYSTKELPGKSGLVPISPGMAAKPYEALAGAGQNVERLGLYAANVFDVLAQKEREAIRQTKALELGESLDNDFNQLTEELAPLSDYEKFVPEMEKKKNAIKEKYLSQVNIDGTPDRTLTLTYEKMFSAKASNFMNDVRRKKLTIITERGQNALFKDLDKDLAKYAMATDEGTKLKTKNEFEIKVEAAVGTLLTAEQARGLVNSFETNAIKKEKDVIEERKGIVRQKIILDPIQTEIDLIGGKYDNFLKTQDAKADMLEQVNRASKIQLNENEKKIKEQNELNHKNDNQKIGDLFLDRKFKEAYILVRSSPWVNGPEKKEWDNAITAKIKQLKEPDEDDPAEYYNILQDVLGATTEKKFEIGTKIVQSGRLKTQTQKTLIKDLLETKEDQQIFNDPWFKFSEKSIKESLGWTEMMGFFNLQNPQEAQSSYRDVVRQLINDIKKDNLKGEEIDKRARQLVLPHQMKVWNMLMGGKKEEPKKKEPGKYNVGQVYTDAQGKKAKYLGAGKWETVK